MTGLTVAVTCPECGRLVGVIGPASRLERHPTQRGGKDRCPASQRPVPELVSAARRAARRARLVADIEQYQAHAAVMLAEVRRAARDLKVWRERARAAEAALAAFDAADPEVAR